MDIAKYMTTALVLSSVFGEMDSPLVMGIVIAGAMLTMQRCNITTTDKTGSSSDAYI